MRPRYYRLVGHDVVPIPDDDVLTWASDFERKDRRLRQDWIGGQFVSTVFLGLDHNYYDEGPPHVFESMIFHGPHDGDQERYSTYDEAIAGHEAMLVMLRRETPWWRRELAPLLQFLAPRIKNSYMNFRMRRWRRSIDRRKQREKQGA